MQDERKGKYKYVNKYVALSLKTIGITGFKIQFKVHKHPNDKSELEERN